MQHDGAGDGVYSRTAGHDGTGRGPGLPQLMYSHAFEDTRRSPLDPNSPSPPKVPKPDLIAHAVASRRVVRLFSRTAT
jgi:hypothetical protein